MMNGRDIAKKVSRLGSEVGKCVLMNKPPPMAILSIIGIIAHICWS